MGFEDELYLKIGMLVRLQRETANLTQDDLAKAVGVTRTSITNIEAGRQKIQIHTLFMIARTLGISPVNLLPLEKSLKTLSIEDEFKYEEEGAKRWLKRIARDVPSE